MCLDRARRHGTARERRRIYTVALVVVPGQLAKLATVAGAQDIIEGFMPDES